MRARLVDSAKAEVGRMFVYAVFDEDTVRRRVVHCHRHANG